MSFLGLRSNIFAKQTPAEFASEMGLVVRSSSGMTNYLCDEMDYNVYVLLTHSPMTLTNLVDAISKIINNPHISTLRVRVLDAIQRLNGDKQRVCRDNDKLTLVNP